MLKITDLNKKFGKLQVLNNINLEFSEPAINILIGPNGSGKTTLLKSILGITHPNSGSIELDNKKIKNFSDFKRNFSYLPQIAQFPDNLTGKDLIKMVKDIRASESMEDKYLEIFNLGKELKKPIKYLSGGNKQKLNTVLSFMFDAKIYIFDEPTVGLDPVSVLNFRDLLLELKTEGKIVILTTHNLDFVSIIADLVIFLLDGNIYFKGSYSDLLENEKSNTLMEAIAKVLKDNDID